MDTTKKLQRFCKSIKEKEMKLISCNLEESNDIFNFSVLGSHGKSYDIKFDSCYECTCPDFMINKLICKHIYLIFVKYFRLIPDIDKKDNKLSKKQFELFIKIHNSNKLRNDECIICYDKLGVNNYVCHVCKNGFHRECISLIIEHNGSNSVCPMCRTMIDKENKESKKDLFT